MSGNDPREYFQLTVKGACSQKCFNQVFQLKTQRYVVEKLLKWSQAVLDFLWQRREDNLSFIIGRNTLKSRWNFYVNVPKLIKFTKLFTHSDFIVHVFPRKFYIRRNRSKISSFETGRTVIAHLLP